MKKLHFRPELILLALFSCVTHFWQLFVPRAVVFDEVHFKGFAAQYLSGEYYFDVHPPLGKLLYALLAWLQGVDPTHMATQPEVSLRIIPAAAGALLVLVVWAILRSLGISRMFAFIGGLLVALDGALLVQSRFATLDILVLLFGFCALYTYLQSRKVNERLHYWWLVATAACLGGAISTKWSGLSAFGIVSALWTWDNRHQLRRFHVRRFASGLGLLLCIPATIYIGSFWLHFSLLPRSGPGDAFMSQRFQSDLIGSAYYIPGKHQNFTQKFIELNTEMFRANGRIPGTHPYGSRWYTWPYLARPIYYWQGETQTDGSQGNIYLLGNPVVWWGMLLAVPLGLLLSSQYRGGLRPKTTRTLLFIAVGYVANYIPYIAFGRVTFIYYYLAAFIFSIIAAVIVWDDVFYGGKQAQPPHFLRKIVWCYVIAAIISFCFFAPLLYGWPLQPDQLESRMWLSTWR